MNARFTGVEGRLGGLETRLGGLETRSDTIFGAVSDLGERVTRLEARTAG